MSQFALTQSEKQSYQWRKLVKHLKAVREELREKNESLTLDERQTQITRGRIAQLNELLALDDPAPGVDP